MSAFLCRRRVGGSFAYGMLLVEYTLLNHRKVLTETLDAHENIEMKFSLGRQRQ